MTETWKDIPGFEGRYQVSDRGNVRGLDREIVDTTGKRRIIKGVTLRPAKAKRSEHRHVILRKEGKSYTRKVHQLVLQAFVGPCPEGMVVCHNNGRAGDNRLENLRYDTPSGNMFDRVKHGTHHAVNKTHCPRGHLLQEPNLVPSRSRDGYRACLACSRARGRRNENGEVTQEISDECYREVIATQGATLAWSSQTACKRGHPYSEGNLVPSALKKGRRDCKACSLARNRVNSRGWGDVKELSDEIFAEMRERGEV